MYVEKKECPKTHENNWTTLTYVFIYAHGIYLSTAANICKVLGYPKCGVSFMVLMIIVKGILYNLKWREKSGRVMVAVAVLL